MNMRGITKAARHFSSDKHVATGTIMTGMRYLVQKNSVRVHKYQLHWSRQVTVCACLLAYMPMWFVGLCSVLSTVCICKGLVLGEDRLSSTY